MSLASSYHRFRYRISRDIGPITEVSRKHRRALLLVSICTLFLDPSVKVTFGKASIGGLGIEITPVQEIPLTLGLFCALVYLLIAFWVSIKLDTGTDLERARRNARDDFDPGHDMQHPDNQNISDLIREHSNYSVFKWNFRRIVWEVLIPSAIALGAIARFIYFKIAI